LTLSVLKDTFIVKNVMDSRKWIVYVSFGYYINNYFIFRRNNFSRSHHSFYCKLQFKLSL